MFGLDDAWAPRRAVVVARAQDQGEVGPAAAGFQSVEVQQPPLAFEVQERGAGHVAVGRLEKHVGRLPFVAARAQPAGQNGHFAAALFMGRKPDGQQVAVVAPGDRRAMIVLRV